MPFEQKRAYEIRTLRYRSGLPLSTPKISIEPTPRHRLNFKNPVRKIRQVLPHILGGD
jgi:hypothetical protein